jgi:N-acetylneuraminic acid mutarotase
MKIRGIAQSAPARRSLDEGGFFNLRASTAILLCAAASCWVLSATVLAFFRPEAAAKVRTLSFSGRVAYQRAIEDVYWRHRIWPKQHPDPKPSLDAVMSQAQLEKKVADYLRKSQALEDHWQRPITAEQLQVEMNRMAQHTKQPEVLRELFEALGNDPVIIAECVARPALVERLMAKFYSHDQGVLGSNWARAQHRIRNVMLATSGNYTLPRISDGPSGCVDNTWTATSTINAPTGRYSHTAVWTGSEMIVWGGVGDGMNTGGRYNPSTDSWTATSTTNAPSARYDTTAVWTGSEMIVWGGLIENPPSTTNTGGRYNPSTDSWTATSTTNAPSARYVHTAVWTGSEMIVWGGFVGSESNTGGGYDRSTDSWTSTSTTNAPTARFDHTAVLTGSEMIVWGGRGNNSPLNTGGRYNPSTDSWTSTSTIFPDTPTARYLHTAVWTGSEMIVWGGRDNQFFLNTGGRYNPSTDSWTSTSTTNAPSARDFHTAVWTGSEMIIWGGFEGSNVFNTGGKYNPGTNSWTSTSTTNAPSARDLHTAVWTFSEMIVWGGEDRCGSRDTGYAPHETWWLT